MIEQVRIPSRFNGPPQSANGGWFAGRLAAILHDDDPAVTSVTVRLSAPPPLEAALAIIETDSGIEVRDRDVRVALAGPGPRPVGPAAGPVSYAQALACGDTYEGLVDHPFPTCFSCGTERGDGLGLRPGPVPDGSGTYAAAWHPREVNNEIVWAALDCPGGWSAGIAGRPMVLGTMTAVVDALPAPGEQCVVMAWPRGGSGRRHESGSALYGADGTLLARAEAIWIAVDPAVIRPR